MFNSRESVFCSCCLLPTASCCASPLGPGTLATLTGSKRDMSPVSFCHLYSNGSSYDNLSPTNCLNSFLACFEEGAGWTWREGKMVATVGVTKGVEVCGMFYEYNSVKST